MNFLSYVVLGGFSYAAGWAIRTKVLAEAAAPEQPYNLKHPTILGYMAGFFIIINSLVATFVFSFGLNPEKASYDVPEWQQLEQLIVS